MAFDRIACVCVCVKRSMIFCFWSIVLLSSLASLLPLLFLTIRLICNICFLHANSPIPDLWRPLNVCCHDLFLLSLTHLSPIQRYRLNLSTSLGNEHTCTLANFTKWFMPRLEKKRKSQTMCGGRYSTDSGRFALSLSSPAESEMESEADLVIFLTALCPKIQSLNCSQITEFIRLIHFFICFGLTDDGFLLSSTLNLFD